MPPGTTMDRTPEQLAEELMSTSPHASVAEITRWVQQQAGNTEPDFQRAVIISYWTLQQTARPSDENSAKP